MKNKNVFYFYANPIQVLILAFAKLNPDLTDAFTNPTTVLTDVVVEVITNLGSEVISPVSAVAIVKYVELDDTQVDGAVAYKSQSNTIPNLLVPSV